MGANHYSFLANSERFEFHKLTENSTSMVEEMEEAQKALRKMDYDSMSDDGDDDDEQVGWSRKKSPKRALQDNHPAAKLPPPEVTSESKSSLETFLSSTDAVGGTINNPDEDLLFGTNQPFSQTNSTPKSSSIASFEISQTRPLVASKPSPMSPSPSDFFAQSPAQNALIDDDDSTTFSVELQTLNTDRNPNDLFGTNSSPDAISNNKYPGTAGFLEMEEEPLRKVQDNNNNAFGSEPIKTDSGLVLTHRKNSNAVPSRNKQVQNLFRDTQQDYFEAENDFVRGSNKGNPKSASYFGGVSGGILGGGNGKHSMVMVQVKRLMSYVKIWVILFLVVAMVMTGVFLHSIGHEEAVTKTDSTSSQQSSANNANTNGNGNAYGFDTVPDQIILVPLTDSSHLATLQQNQQHQNQPRRLQDDVSSNHQGNVDGSHHFLKNLRQEFETWILHHGKTYHSDAEKEHRFSIWARNHQRTAEKNAKHGPCKLTKQHVFGSNQFKDLAPEEFQNKFLTGYKGAFTDELEKKHQELSPAARRARNESGIGKVLDPKIHKVNIHESVVEKQRHLKQRGSEYQPYAVRGSSMHCNWYDLSCTLRFMWKSTGISVGSFIGTMEPKYDADAYPNAVDWRDSGAVTSVRTQGDCGACWAVTAVETVESAHFIATGNLYTLSESEIIVCDESCDMCSGGWPQNAFEWVMEHGGLPLQNTLPYDAYTLLALTSALEGTSNYYTEETVETYRGEVCPADYNSRNNDGNNEDYWGNGAENENYGDYSSQGRYGNIKGYGYATDRCMCYTDGSGCDCDDQDEDTAIRNIATYGPAVVCLEASTWQDYYGGIITSEIGCGMDFSDMNHCVQVVGYAFNTKSNCNDAEGNCNNMQDSGSGSNSEDGSGDREGYWIVRNQWGESWGMNGYAYVSMGENTCGILNDMAIAYA